MFNEPPLCNGELILNIVLVKDESSLVLVRTNCTYIIIMYLGLLEKLSLIAVKVVKKKKEGCKKILRRRGVT